MSLLPSPADRSLVVFRAGVALTYERRLLLALLLIVGGFAIQGVSGSFLAGVLPLLGGNLLLIVRGYDNRVEFGSYRPDTEWERIEPARLAELEDLDRRIRRWDQSLLDVTNVGGAVMFVLVAGILAVTAALGPGPFRLLGLDGLVLLLPHWVTGVRFVLRKPKLLVKVRTLLALLDGEKSRLAEHDVVALALLEGEDTRVPVDVKIKVDLAGHHASFLGLYGQVVLNEVQGHSYPYFYVVLVARKGFRLDALTAGHQPASGITREFKRQDAVEVLVLRQTTSRTSGYHTKPPAVSRIFRDGLELAERVASGQV